MRCSFSPARFSKLETLKHVPDVGWTNHRFDGSTQMILFSLGALKDAPLDLRLLRVVRRRLVMVLEMALFSVIGGSEENVQSILHDQAGGRRCRAWAVDEPRH